MTEAQTFQCPSCNAPLVHTPNLETVTCPYCGNTVIVPKELSDVDTPGEGQTDYAQTPVVFTSAFTLQFDEIKELLRNRQKVEAVKRVRNATGLGLKDSKDIVDLIEKGQDAQALSRLLAALNPGSSATAVDVSHLFQTPIAQNENQETAVKTAAVGAGVAGVSLSCWVIGLIVVILAVTIIPIFFAFVQGGGPLAPFWNQVNPVSAVDIELSFGEEGIGAGQFTDPRSVATDTDGNLYVADYSSGRLQSFNPQGEFRWLVNLGKDQFIQSLEIDRSGILLSVVRGALRRFDASSGDELQPPGGFADYYFEDLSVAPDGDIAALVNSEDLLVLSPDYTTLTYVPAAVSTASGESELDADIDIDGLGNLYVLGSFNSSIFKFNPQGRFINRFASDGDQPGQLRAPGDLAVDGQGRVYVSDFNGVQVFDANGLYLHRFDLSGYVFGLNFGADGMLYTISNEPKLMRLRLKK